MRRSPEVSVPYPRAGGKVFPYRLAAEERRRHPAGRRRSRRTANLTLQGRRRRTRMCGIVGFLDRTGGTTAPVGRHLLEMLTALGRRGPDSAGVAIFGGRPASAGGDRSLVLRVKLGERGNGADDADQLL